MGKNDKIMYRAVIRYLGLKGKTPKQAYQDMKATLGEKWAGKFKRGKESLEDKARPGKLQNAKF